LNEILSIDPTRDIDFKESRVKLRKAGPGDDGTCREVQIPDHLAKEIEGALGVHPPHAVPGKMFKVDPSHVRRSFYDRAQAGGLARDQGTPEAIRRARAVELMQSNVPLPVVQRIMGHSTPNLAASYVAFSDKEIRQVERFFIERENQRKTSARNAFFGKIAQTLRGDVQTALEIAAMDGHTIHAIITNFSQSRLGLHPGILVSAEIKAPWVALHKSLREPRCSAENRFRGKVSRIVKGEINSEVVVRISDSTELCAIISENSRSMLGIEAGDAVWAVFNAAAVVIHAE